MAVKTYAKNANPIEFIQFTGNESSYDDFLKDDTKNQVSFEDGKINVHTDWGDYSGGEGYIIAKYGPGDYNLIEPSIFEKTYEKLSDDTAVKVAKVQAVEFTGDNYRDIIRFVGVDNIEFECGFSIKTLEGVATLKEGDYVLKGVNGEFYPNDKATFEKNYHEVKNEFEKLKDSLDKEGISYEYNNYGFVENIQILDKSGEPLVQVDFGHGYEGFENGNFEMYGGESSEELLDISKVVSGSGVERNSSDALERIKYCVENQCHLYEPKEDKVEENKDINDKIDNSVCADTEKDNLQTEDNKYNDFDTDSDSIE